jgi:TolB protein
VTTDLGNYGSVSLGLTRDSLSLITVQTERVSNIWISPIDDSKGARQITSRGNIYDGQAGLASTPDGRVVYSSSASGNFDIWIMGHDGTGQRQLTDDSHFDGRPAISTDGRYIVFMSDRTGASNIWRMNLDGGGLKKLTDGKLDKHPDCSPDGQWIIYESIGDSGVPGLWRVSIEGGSPSQVTDKWASRPAISPDGKMIAYIREEGQANKQLKLVVIPFEGGQAIKTFDFPLTVAPLFRWSPTGDQLVYNDTSNSVSNLWSLPLDGSKPSQITDFKSDQVFSFSYSNTPHEILFSRGNVSRDVVLISDTK